MVIWSNLAFINDNDDNRSSQGKFSILKPSERDLSTNRSSFFTSHLSEEEFQIREELGREIEKELEREIMEGILVLVKRLSNLKAKQILRSLKKLNLDEFLNLLHGSSNCGTTCEDGGDHHEDEYELGSQLLSGQISPTISASVTQFSIDNQEEGLLEDSDKESTVETWSYLSE